MKLNESLRANDLKNLVKKVFEIDAYKSKIGEDSDIIVLSFTVEYSEPAKDLENFVEMGYDFVLDADVSPGETDDGTYKVFIEIERNRHAAENIYTLLDGIERLTGMPDMRFRYFKSFKSYDATLENLQSIIPFNKDDYDAATDTAQSDNYSNFFSTSNVDSANMVGESIVFKRVHKEPLIMKVVESGEKVDVYNKLSGPLLFEHTDVSQILFLTKYIGNYNISKIGNTFVFEKDGWAVAMEK